MSLSSALESPSPHFRDNGEVRITRLFILFCEKLVSNGLDCPLSKIIIIDTLPRTERSISFLIIFSGYHLYLKFAKHCCNVCTQQI